MKGYLIYDRDNVARNQRFIDFFMDAASAHQVNLQLIFTDEISFGVQSGQFFMHPEKPDFAVMRCMQPLLSHHLELCGVKVFNNAQVSAVCNDKRITHQFLTQHHLPTLPTAFVNALLPCHPFDYPVVVKAARGCGGRKVFLCENHQDYLEKLQLIAPDDAVVQPLCDTPGRDVRIYLLGGKPVQAMLRYSDQDFRSNFGLHGTAKPIDPTDEMLSICGRVADLLQPDLVGVDFIFHQGKTYLNEIEDAVGTRMLYQYTDLNIVDMYMAHILHSITL